MRTARGGARRRFGVGVLLLALAVVAVLLLTSQISLLSTRGNSMSPQFHTGDLAITLARPSYAIGDIAAYRAEPNGAIVLHRIVAKDHGRVTFKGDNNSWRDPTHPRESELVGKLWFHVPGAGVLANAKGGVNTGLLVAGVLLLLFGGSVAHHRARRSRRGNRAEARTTRPSPDHPARPARPTRPPSRPTRVLGPVSFALRGGSELGHAVADLAAPIAATLVALLLVGLSFSVPTTRSATAKRTAKQEITWGYTATAPTGTTYPSGSVTTGEPIFLRLVQQIDFQLGYHLKASADELHNVAGSYSIDAVVTGIGDWTRTIELQGRTHFSGAAFSTQVTLDIPRIQAIVSAAQSETGVKGANVVVNLTPHVTTNGFAGEVPINATYDTPLALRLSPLDLTPVKAEPTAPTAPDATSPKAEAVSASSLGGTVDAKYEATVAKVRKLSLFGRSITVFRARLFTLIALLGCGAWLAFVVVTHRRLRLSTEAARLAYRYRSQIVEVSTLPQVTDMVDVADMAALARIAERGERLILHHVDGVVDTFLVEDDVTTYRFRVVEPSTPVEPATTTVLQDSPTAHEEDVARSAGPGPESPPPWPPPTTTAEDLPPPIVVEPPASAAEPVPSTGFLAASGHAGFDAGTPPPFAGTPPPYSPEPCRVDDAIWPSTLAEALFLSPISEDEADEFGVSPRSDHSRR